MLWFRKILVVVLSIIISSSSAQESTAISVVDDSGRQIELKQPAQRIISLAPHLTETLFEVGAGKQIVGTVSYSDYPVQAQDIQRVGNYKKVNTELILSMKPDLIVSWNSGNGEDMGSSLRDLGLTVYASDPTQLEDVARILQHLGKLTGHSKQGLQASQDYLDKFKKLKKAFKTKRPISVFYQIGGSTLITLNGEHIISDVIRLCGGYNIFSDAMAIAPRVNIESVLAVDPDMIVTSGMGEEHPEWLDEWQRWPSLKAVKNKHLFFVPPDIIQRHSTRILQGAEMLCHQINEVRLAVPTL